MQVKEGEEEDRCSQIPGGGQGWPHHLLGVGKQPKEHSSDSFWGRHWTSPDNPNSPDLLGLEKGMEGKMKKVVLGPSDVSH